MAKPIKQCITCHGNGVVQKIKNGKVTVERCPACNGKGYIDTRTL